jgi:hypothetical protein
MLAAFMLCASSSIPVADERQYKIEAAYLYNFFNYITWPGYPAPQALENPVICVYGGDPILPYLNYMREKVTGQRSLSVRSVADEPSSEGCNILFMRHRTLPSASLPASTLTVFKPDDPLDSGGMIELAQDGDRISIKIHQSQLEKNGFSVSSRLLDLAQRER